MAFSRRIEDYVLVTLITLLIWFYAESRTLDQYTPTSTGPFSVQLRSANKDMVIVGQSTHRLSLLEFSGSRYAIGKLRAALAGGLTLDVELVEPGRKTLSLAQLITDAFDDLNVSLNRIEPESVEIVAARKVTREAELRFAPEEVQLQDGEADIDPPVAQITLPEDQLPDVTVDGKVVLYVRPTRETDLKSLPANRKLTLPAEVELPPALRGSPHAEVRPAGVSLSFIIEKKEETETLKSVSVFLSAPPSEWSNFRVEVHEEDRLLKDVEVTGPLELIERVRSGEITLVAQAVLSRDDLVKAAARDEITVPVMILTLPPISGLTVDSPKAFVRVKVARLEP